MNLLYLKLWQGMTFQRFFFHGSHVFAVWGANERTKQLVDLMVRNSNCSIYPTFYSRWWFQIFFISTPICGRFPIWLIFFRWVGSTTNQYCLDVEFGWNRNPLKRHENSKKHRMDGIFQSRAPAARAAVGLVARQKGWLVFFQVLKWTTWRIIPGLVRAENNHG